MTFAVNYWFPWVNFCTFYHVSFTCQRHGFIEFISCFLRFDLILWALHFCEEPNKVPFDFKTLGIFWMNNKTITGFGFCIIWRILHISEVVVVCLSLWHNSSNHAQHHCIVIVKYFKPHPHISQDECVCFVSSKSYWRAYSMERKKETLSFYPEGKVD